jgi:hypothetical protein
MTNFEKQKSEIESQGFDFEKTLENPVLSSEESTVIQELIMCLCRQNKNSGLHRDLKEDMLVDSFAVIYDEIPKPFINLFKKSHFDVTTKLAFGKMKKRKEYQDEINDLTSEGEIREVEAYYSDGDSINPDCKNVYFKHTR